MKNPGDPGYDRATSLSFHAVGLTTGLITALIGSWITVALATDAGTAIQTEGYLARETILLVNGAGIAAGFTAACWFFIYEAAKVAYQEFTQRD